MPTTTHPRSSSNGSREAHERSFSIDPYGLASVTKTFFLDLPMALGREAMRFAGDRLQAQSAHLTALSQCRTGKDFIDEQFHYARVATADYGREAATVARTAGEVVAASAHRDRASSTASA